MTSELPEIERVVARLRPHGRALVLPSLMLFVSVGAMAYFSGSFALEWQNIAVVAAGLFVIVVFFLIPLLAWLSHQYTITTRRIIIRSGFFVRLRQELLHSRGYDVAVRRHALQSVWRSGDILINSGLEHPVRLKDVPSADLVLSALHDLMEKQNPVAARRQAEDSQPDPTRVWGER